MLQILDNTLCLCDRISVEWHGSLMRCISRPTSHVSSHSSRMPCQLSTLHLQRDSLRFHAFAMCFIACASRYIPPTPPSNDARPVPAVADVLAAQGRGYSFIFGQSMCVHVIITNATFASSSPPPHTSSSPSRRCNIFGPRSLPLHYALVPDLVALAWSQCRHTKLHA